MHSEELAPRADPGRREPEAGPWSARASSGPQSADSLTVDRLSLAPPQRSMARRAAGRGRKRLLWLLAGVGLLALVIAWQLLTVQGAHPQTTPTATPTAQQVAEQTAITQPASTARQASAAQQTATAPAPTSTTVSLLSSATAAPSMTPTQLGMGSTQVSPVDGALLVYVPAGEFLMGSNVADGQAMEDTKPQHSVFLDAFWLDRTEVTNAQYARCVLAGVCAAPGVQSSATHATYYADPAFADFPVMYVDWRQASLYCTWVGRRLPSEAEWEKAARGVDERSYPWGNSPPACSRANYAGCVGDTTSVGSYPEGASPYGALDMTGNVWEWVDDWYQPQYYSTSAAGEPNPQGPESGQKRVLRGGSWNAQAVILRVVTRNFDDPANPSSLVGFRCADDP